MRRTAITDTVRFSTKGRVVIPLHLRKEYEIEAGTRARVVATPEGILIRPVTRSLIRSLRGSFKGLGLTEALEEDRRREAK